VLSCSAPHICDSFGAPLIDALAARSIYAVPTRTERDDLQESAGHRGNFSDPRHKKYGANEQPAREWQNCVEERGSGMIILIPHFHCDCIQNIELPP
jgi:hypothetical protein